MVNVIVRNKGNTLVMELPRSTWDMHEKLRSIGVTNYANQIPITDKEEDDIGVKLYAESDIGNHLALVFSEKDTLSDVNITLQTVLDADEAIKSDLENDIIYDQFDSAEELRASIKERIQSAGEYAESFYFPLRGSLEHYEYDDTQEVSNMYLRDYGYAIREKMEQEQKDQVYDLAHHYWGNESVKQKLVSAVWTVEDVNNTLYGCVKASMKEPLTEDEKTALKSWISGQNSDGFGEGFEQRPLETENGDLYISFWSRGEDYFVYTQEEMDEYISQEQGLQMGGM